MKLTQIRNATNRLEYADKTFLIDPWLMPKHQFSFSFPLSMFPADLIMCRMK